MHQSLVKAVALILMALLSVPLYAGLDEVALMIEKGRYQAALDGRNEAQ